MGFLASHSVPACGEALGFQKMLAVGMRLQGRGTLAWRGEVVREEKRIAEEIGLVERNWAGVKGVRAP